MEIEENKVYRTKNDYFVQVKEITKYYNTNTSICHIVTRGIAKFSGAAKTNILRKVYTEQEFRDLIVELKPFKCPNCNQEMKLEFIKKQFRDYGYYDVWGCEDCAHIQVLDMR